MKIARAMLSAHMRILILTILASAVIGCGGEVESNAATGDDDAAAVVATCDPTQGIQAIGQVPGYVFSVTGAGSNLYAVSAMFDDSGQVSSAVGTLYRVGANSSQALTDKSVDPFNVASLGTTLGFIHASVTSRGLYADDAVRMIDASGNLTTLAQGGGNAFSSLTKNGAAFSWLQTQGSTNQPKSSMIASSSGAAPSVTSLGNGVVMTSNFVSDGAHLYGAFSTNDADSVVGEIPMSDASSLVLDPTPGAVAAMVGVDDQNVYYVAATSGAQLETLWSVPKSGSRPPTVLAQVQYGTNVVIAKGNAYWLDLASVQGSIMTVPLTLVDVGDAEQPVHVVYQLAGTPQQLTAIGVDDCGILMAANVSENESSILRMPLQ
jgi:hypothetical protein